MNFPVLTALALVFILWINYEIRKDSRKSNHALEEFLGREKSSNSTRSKEISDLTIMVISTELLPMEDSSDAIADSYRDIIRGLCGYQAINLCHQSNTELKLLYGPANLKRLSEYDANYTRLVSILQKWASRLHTVGYDDLAMAVLQYAITCNTDVPASYLLLAELHHQLQNTDAIQELIRIVEPRDIFHKKQLILQLSQLLHS